MGSTTIWTAVMARDPDGVRRAIAAGADANESGAVNAGNTKSAPNLAFSRTTH